jgi:hypothetical protein
MSNEKQFSEGFTPNLPLWSFQLQKDSKLALKTRKDLEIHLITRALKDESFRAELIANPKAVIEQEIGSKLPDELEITVLEETADTIYMVLPCNPYEGLSEEELQANLGMTYKDVAQWVLEQQQNKLLEQERNVSLLCSVWQSTSFMDDLVSNPVQFLEKQNLLNTSIDVNIKVLLENTVQIYFVFPNILLDDFEALYSDVFEDELMLNILATPCFNSFADPCCTGTLTIP